MFKKFIVFILIILSVYTKPISVKMSAITLRSFSSSYTALDKTAMEYFNLAKQARKEYRYTEAIEYYKLAGKLWKEADRKDYYAMMMNSIGATYSSLKQYDKAIEYYRKALAIAEELGSWRKKAFSAMTLSHIGRVYDFWEQYDKAIENFRKALAIDDEIGNKEGISMNLNDIGSVYNSLGQYDKAIENYRKALAIKEENYRKEKIAITLSKIGLLYHSWDKYDKAIENFRKALAIAEELGIKGEIARVLNNIGMVYDLWGQYDKAIDNYRKALAISEELGRKGDIAKTFNNIGIVYKQWEQYDKAIEYYRKALAINEELGRKEGIAIILDNIGIYYFELKEYEKAEDNLNKSIEIKDKLRLTAEGAVRRDYLASQIGTYQNLISTYIKSNKPALAFNTIELSSAKYLIEQMGERLKEKDIVFKGIKNYQKKLNYNTVIINYSNINTWTGTAQIVVDKNNIFTIEVKDDSLISNIKYKNVISNAVENLRGIKIKGKDKEEKVIEKGDDDFEKIINYYRLLLSKSNLDSKEEETIQYIGKELYKFLFGSIEEQLKGKDELIIIPDGVLSFLPFETLIMPDGRYLIEKYHIKYTQSLTVSEIVAKRHYSENRKPLLAFGGAVYDELSYETDIVKSEKHLEYITNETLLSLNRGQDVRKAYASLELSEWKNLPSTLAEVKALQYLIKDSDIYTGKSVAEYLVKSLSDKGKLKNYKVLHFATHGLVVPEIPELSAIVLSLLKDENNNEDGYLTMKEIANLDINADFVNLSACETGLGKIYGGEGVVGLTQGFLVAGANGLSVSLWQVADESTMKFMIGVYKLVQEKVMSYDRAITEMKRAFISGAVSTEKYDRKRGLILSETDLQNKKPNDYSNPFYWAPFVYYGK